MSWARALAPFGFFYGCMGATFFGMRELSSSLTHATSVDERNVQTVKNVVTGVLWPFHVIHVLIQDRQEKEERHLEDRARARKFARALAGHYD